MRRGLALVLVIVVAAAIGAGASYMSAQSELEDVRDELRGQQRVANDAEQKADGAHKEAAEQLEQIRRLKRRVQSLSRRSSGLEKTLGSITCFADRRPARQAFFRRPYRADVTGDGSVDEVQVIGLPSQHRPCRYTLNVASSEGRFVAVIRYDPDELERNSAPLEFADLDATPGKEIAVHVTQGAYASIVKLFALSHGQLQPIRGLGRTQWIYGASAGNGSNFDCPSPGTVIRTSWSYAENGPGHEVTRRIHRVAGAQATLIDRERSLMRKWDEKRIAPENECFPLAEG